MRGNLIDAVFSLPGRRPGPHVKRVEAMGDSSNRRCAVLLTGVSAPQNHSRRGEKDKKSYAGQQSSLLREPQERVLSDAIRKVKADTVAAINVEKSPAPCGRWPSCAARRAFFARSPSTSPECPTTTSCAPTASPSSSEIRAATLTVADFSKISGDYAITMTSAAEAGSQDHGRTFWRVAGFPPSRE